LALPQHIQYGVGGTVEVELTARPTNALGTVYNGDGTSRGTITGTVSTIDTVINVAATRGTRTVSVSSNTGMGVGKTIKFIDDPETAIVRKVDGCNIYFRERLLNDHVNAANAVGMTVTFAANSAVANTLFFDGHIDINIDGGTSFVQTAVECTKYPLTNLCTTQDLFDIEPALYQLLDDDTDLERWKDVASQYVLSRIATSSPDLRARVFPGSSEFAHATALAAMMYLYGRQHGDEADEMYKRYKDRLDSEIARVSQTTPRDTDQDSSIELNERISAYGGKVVM
jgi:prepilin-type processing-associated H-X9-DG protein